MTDLSIITLTYNSAAYIGRLLDSIAKSKDRLSKQVVIVDNASQDTSATVVARHPLKPTLIQSPTNIGFAKGVNLGIKQATGNYLLLLNPDTQLVGNCLQTLFDFAQATSPLGAIAPTLLYPDGRPQPSVFRFPTIGNALRHDFLGQKTAFGKYLPAGRHGLPAGKTPQIVDATVMAALLIPRSTLNDVGLLDERFFLYYEDIEFCRRLKRHHLPVYYLPTAKVKHVHGASGKFTQHLHSPLLQSSYLYYGPVYARLLNSVLWLGHKWQVILRRRRFRD